MGGKLPGKIVYFDGTNYFPMGDIGECPQLTSSEDELDNQVEPFTWTFTADIPPNFIRKLRWMMIKNHLKVAFDLIFRRSE